MSYLSMQASLRKLPLRRASKITLGLVILGLLTFAGCLSWWLQGNRLSSPWLLLAFMIFGVYGTVQLIGSWLLYIAAYHGNRYSV